MSFQKQKGRKKRNGDDVLERGETTPILDSSEKTIDLGKRLRNISKLLVLGVFLEPVLDFLGFHFIHSHFNGALIPVSRVDLQKSTAPKRRASYSSCCLSARSSPTTTGAVSLQQSQEWNQSWCCSNGRSQTPRQWMYRRKNKRKASLAKLLRTSGRWGHLWIISLSYLRAFLISTSLMASS